MANLKKIFSRFGKKTEEALDDPDAYGGYSARRPTAEEKAELEAIVAGSENKGGLPARKVKTKGGFSMPKDVPDSSSLVAPAVHSKGHEALINRIFEDAKENRRPIYNMAEEPVFGPADAELTKQLVPQRSVSGDLPPKPGRGDRLPRNERSRFILENEGEIGDVLAGQLQESKADPLPFYSTGSVLQGLEDRAGLSRVESLDFMRDWAGQGAGTSPRTQTGPNLKNASLLQWRRAIGDPLTAERQAEERQKALWGFPGSHNEKPGQQANLNRPGFAMMGMHTDLADQFANDTVDPWKNPKPYTFRENWMGNMADVTADTHNIRAVLDAYDQLAPGKIPREWFKSEDAYRRYVEGGGFPAEGALPMGDIEDGLQGQMLNGRYAQTEYPIIQGPTEHAARQLNISPAEAQERLWFERGHRTGLQSPRMAIPDLLNAQIERTAKVTGLHPEVILRLWARRKIPLAENEPMNDLPGAQANV